MVRLGTIVIGADDVDRAVAFWSAAMGYDVVRFDGTENGFTILRPPSGEGTRLAIQHADTPASEHPRLHIDLIVDSAAEQRSEVERLVSLGAQRVDWDSYDDDPDWIVIADTEGNRFCVVDASHG
ncbi:VOC family protein [Ilumatobacter coccineus]|uniref:VOC domain-containing protein n=1 Tax=Ilumatobacter coccineus (strain NBRC 103263 / KCTC 29153 / YM16-304) TaxID=1313172 RepID=A0A6C7E6C6_ILUCY|nr:VOC family protein [Ilumatobacter coccineus]BAN02061.1 hypothetical protein YM304_17470 [Ilumatobacter coccineus YM16-304]